MPSVIEIENIEAMRLEQGIDDDQLRLEIRALRVGDFVRITLLSDKNPVGAGVVRLTQVRGNAFRGKLVKKPAALRTPRLRAGDVLVFTAAHIHSVVPAKTAKPAHA